MRFHFKIQQYQTEAVDSVVRIFDGQPYSSGISYRRDLGIEPPKKAVAYAQTNFLAEQQTMIEETDDTGFCTPVRKTFNLTY